MTDLLSRTERPSAPPTSGHGPTGALPALLAAIWAALVGLIGVTVVVLIAWSTDTRSGSSAAEALRTAAQIWLVGQGGRLQLPHGTFALLPLGLAIIAAWLLTRAGASLGRSLQVNTLRSAAPRIGMLATAYGLLGVAAAEVSRLPRAHIGMVSAFVGPAVVALLAGGYGCLREAGLLRQAWAMLPRRLRPVVHGGAVVAAAVYAAGALLIAGGLAVSATRSGQLLQALDPGVVGTLALLVISAAYAPSAAVWGAAVVSGPGFTIGSGTAVGLFGVSLGPVPAFPLLAALPEGPIGFLWPVLAVPFAAGLIGGVVVGRAATEDDDLNGTLVRAACCGAAGGVLLGLLALITAGAAGAAQLSWIGPSPWQIALAVAAEAALPAVAGAWWAIRRRA